MISDKYPYTSMSENRDTKWVEIRANANSSKILWDIYIKASTYIQVLM